MTARPLINDRFLAALFLTSLVCNLYLGTELRHCGRATVVGAKPIAVGTVVQTLRGNDSAGVPVAVTLSGTARPSVVFAYSPTCKWCKLTWPKFRMLALQRSASYRFIAVCLGQGKDAFPIDFPAEALNAPSDETLRALRLSGVPQTIVFSREGRVEKSWVGGYEAGQKVEVYAYFGVQE
jgi:hypothetical protein